MVDTYRLYRALNGEVIKLVVKRSLDATDHEGLYMLLNLNLLREAGLYAHDILWKFGEKQCIEKESFKILLKYLPCKGKLSIEAVDDVTENTVYKIVVDHRKLGEIVEEPLALGRVTVKNL